MNESVNNLEIELSRFWSLNVLTGSFFYLTGIIIKTIFSMMFSNWYSRNSDPPRSAVQDYDIAHTSKSSPRLLSTTPRSPNLQSSNTNICVKVEDDEIPNTINMMIPFPCLRPKREQGERVCLNIKGRRFETYKRTLTSKEGSIFRLDGISQLFDSKRKEYYFDREPKSFEAILTYMQCGACVKPEEGNVL